VREDLKLTRRSIGWQIADQFAGAFPPGWCLRPDKTTAVWSAPPLAVSTGETRVSPPGFRCELRSRHPYRVEVHADQPAQSLQRAPLPGASFCACAGISGNRHPTSTSPSWWPTWCDVDASLQNSSHEARRGSSVALVDFSRSEPSRFRHSAPDGCTDTPSGLSDLR